MRKLDRPWIWILDRDAEFRTLIAGFASHFHFQTFDFSDFSELKDAYLFYRDHVRRYPSTHCLCGVVAFCHELSQKERLLGLFSEMSLVLPDIKTILIQEDARPRSVVDIYRLLERFKS